MQNSSPRILLDGVSSVRFSNGFVEYEVCSGGVRYRFCHTLHHAIATHREMGRVIENALRSSETVEARFR